MDLRRHTLSPGPQAAHHPISAWATRTAPSRSGSLASPNTGGPAAPDPAHQPGNAPGGGAGAPRTRTIPASRLRRGRAEGGGGLVCEQVCEGREVSRPSVVLRRARAGGGGGMRRGGGAGAGAGLGLGRARAADPGVAAAAARVSRRVGRRRATALPHFFFFLNNRNQ